MTKTLLVDMADTDSEGSEVSGSANGDNVSVGGQEGTFSLESTEHMTKKPKHQTPQDAIDEFWAKFDTKTPGKAYTVLPRNLYAKKAKDNAPKGTVEGENALSSYEEAAKTCQEKVAKIVKECRRVNQKYVDKHFNIEWDLKQGRRDCLTTLDNEGKFTPGSAKRVGDIFEDPKFFSEGATANDIRQGRGGDCWLLAALGTLGNKEGLIEKICVARDEVVGVYGFVFNRDGEWISEIIDDKLYLIKPDYDESILTRELIDEHRQTDAQGLYRKTYQTNSKALYFAQCSDPNETWLPLLEKAYAKAHGDYAAIEGGFTGEALEDLTGGVTSEIYTTDILDKDYFWNEELMHVNKEYLFGCSSGLFGGQFEGRGSRNGVVEHHAYSIMKCTEVEGKRFCLIRNPWGLTEWNGAWSDGSKEWTPEWMKALDHKFGDDGQFWMTYEDLLSTYQMFDRTRLFTDEWKVTQQWTSVTVPWSVDYSDTKFSFTIEKETSVVLVFSQLDDRYFRGLEGQYRFALAFRIHKAGEEDYIVRSHDTYRMSRSASAELTLAAGEYHVLMKIKAQRWSDLKPTEEVLRANVKSRRDKVLRVGLSYDMAHAKGQIVDTEEETKGRKKGEEARKAKQVEQIKAEMFLHKQREKHRRNRDARRDQKNELKKREKKRLKQAKMAEKQESEPANDSLVKRHGNEDGASKVKVAPEIKPTESHAVAETATESYEKAESSTSVKIETPPDKGPPESNQKANPEDTKPVEKAVSITSTLETSKEHELSQTIPEEETIEPIETITHLAHTDAHPQHGPTSSHFETPDSGDESDLESISSTVSTVSTFAAEDNIRAMAYQAKLDAREARERAVANPQIEESEDEFEADPWNAVAIVGLRIYAKNCDVTVKVVRPRSWEVDFVEGEAKLDVDDSARDATAAVADSEKNDGEEGGLKEFKNKEDGSDGSAVVV